MLHKLVNSFRPERQVRPLSSIIGQVRRQSLTYLDVDALDDLHSECQRIEDDAIEGVFMETGCALGGSAIVIASAKKPSRPLLVYDVFDTIPPPSDADGDDVHARYETILRGKAEGFDGNRYYGYEESLLDKVRDNFRSCGIDPDFSCVDFIKGLFEDTLYIDRPVALAHIDGDWYESVTVCLERIAPRLQIGGTIIVDDYHHWSGCRRAVDDFLARHKRGLRTYTRSRLHIHRC